jgi:acyl-CoA thioester hydrolase
MTQTLVTYRGCVNAWECDQWGHQNVQFYLAKAADAQSALCCAVGLTPSMLRAGKRMVRPVHDRILFKRELRAGDPLYMRSGVRSVEDATLRYFSVMINAESGAQAAVFETEATLCDISTGKPIELPTNVAEQAKRLCGIHSTHPAPRPIEGTRAPSENPRHAVMTHRGAITAWEHDESGTTPPRFQIARFGQSATRLAELLGLTRSAMLEQNLGSAALDYSMEYRSILRPGQTIELRSGVIEVRRKVLRVYHQVIDSQQNAIASVAEIALVFFDLSARKAVEMPQRIRASASKFIAV